MQRRQSVKMIFFLGVLMILLSAEITSVFNADNSISLSQTV